MWPDLLDLLWCPVCHADLSSEGIIANDGAELVEGSLCCLNGHEWRITEGVLDFGVEEGLSDHWASLLPTYEDFLHNEGAGTVDAGIRAIECLCEHIDDCAPRVAVDIATGSALMLRRILANTTCATHFVATDLSFVVLKYDRRFLKERFGDKRVSFIACDGADLPFKPNVIDMVVSFAGIGGNCLDRSIPALREAARVLAPGGVLAHEQLIIERGSVGYKTLTEELIRGNQLDQRNMIDPSREGIAQAYLEMPLGDVSVDLVEEGYGGPDRDTEQGPLFPYPNEWYGDAVVTSRKQAAAMGE